MGMNTLIEQASRAASTGVYFECVERMLVDAVKKGVVVVPQVRRSLYARGVMASFDLLDCVLHDEGSFFAAQVWIDSVHGYARLLGAHVEEELGALCARGVEYSLVRSLNDWKRGVGDALSFAAAGGVDATGEMWVEVTEEMLRPFCGEKTEYLLSVFERHVEKYGAEKYVRYVGVV